VGNDAASSAQSKRVGDGEDGGDSETVRSRGFWGELGGWDGFRGCPEALCRVFRRFRVVGRGSECCRAGGLVGNNGDVAVALSGSEGETGGCGAVNGFGGVLVGFCNFGDSRYSTVSGDDGAAVISDVAPVVEAEDVVVGSRCVTEAEVASREGQGGA
jgi:hypothetical protein